MRYEEVRQIRYSHRLKRECEFRIVFAVSEGPRAGIEKWFKLTAEEMPTLR